MKKKIFINLLLYTLLIGGTGFCYSAHQAKANAFPMMKYSVKAVANDNDLLPSIKNLTGSSGLYTVTPASGMPIKIRPFSKSYKGKIWAKEVTFGDIGGYYIFATQEAWAYGCIKLYSGTGKLLQTVKPFGGFAFSGLNLDITVETMTNRAYLAVGAKKLGTVARIYKVTQSGLVYKMQAKATTKPGSVVPQFLRLSSDNTYSLATIANKLKSSIRVWIYDPTDDIFVRETKYPLSELQVKDGKISLIR